MSAPQSTPLSPAPGPNDPGEVFDAKAFQFTSELEPFRQQLQEQADYIDDGVAAVENATSAAIQQTNNALAGALSAESGAQSAQFATEASAATAIAAANFKGRWSGLSGALSIPASVEHDGYFWMLLSNVSDVATKTPGVSPEWKIIVSDAVKERLLAEATMISDFANSRYELYEGPTKGMQSKTFAEMWDFTRGTTATGRNATGGISDVAVDEQRLVGNRDGLLIEEQRTNLYTKSEPLSATASGSVPSTIGTQTVSFFGRDVTLATAMFSSASQSGYAGSRVNFEGNFSFSAGLTYTFRYYIMVSREISAGESFTFIFTGSAGAYPKTLNASSGLIPGEFFEVSGSGVVNPTVNGSNSLYLYPQSTVSGDIKFIVCGIQVEQSSIPTSYIPTNGTQITRQADNCSRLLGQEFNQDEFTVYIDLSDRSSVEYPDYITLKGATINKAIFLWRVKGENVYRLTIDGNDTLVSGPSSSNPKKMAISLTRNHIALAVDGVSSEKSLGGVRNEKLVSLLVTKTASNYLMGTVRSTAVIPRALSAAELEALTS